MFGAIKTPLFGKILTGKVAANHVFPALNSGNFYVERAVMALGATCRQQ